MIESELQVCTGARAEEDTATGSILKCLVSSVDNVSMSCARETGRAARNALTFYSPKAPVTDVCDSDVASLCLGTQGLQSMSLGQVCTPAPLFAGPLGRMAFQRALHLYRSCCNAPSWGLGSCSAVGRDSRICSSSA